METTTPLFLVVGPERFNVSYSINPWMVPSDWQSSFADTAADEWRGFTANLIKAGGRIARFGSPEGVPDLVFTANAATVLNRKVLLARFKCPERRLEEPLYREMFETLLTNKIIDEIVELPDGVVLEGAGDCVLDKYRKMYWMGYGQRSDYEAHYVVRDYFGVPTQPLRLVSPHFYHLDTCLSSLPTGEILYVPEAFDEESLRSIYDRVDNRYLIDLQPEDANLFAANAVILNRTILMSNCSQELREQLEGIGYEVVENPLASFHRAGGSAFCLTLCLTNSI